MSELPLRPPIVVIVPALVGCAIMRIWSHRLDREVEEARRHLPPAE